MADRPKSSDNERGGSEINSNNDSNYENTEDVDPAMNNSASGTHTGRNSSHSNHSNSSPHNSGTSSGASSKRKENNPYSFKHFLTGGKQNVGTSHPHHTVSRSNESDENNTMDPSIASSCSRTNRNLILNNPDLASGLPDFVQDHLIMEQCFLESSSNNASNPSFNLENSHIYHIENAILNSSCEESPNTLRSANANDIPFDLTSTMPSEKQEESPIPTPLDLPTYHASNSRSGRPRDPPLDLPSSSMAGSGSANSSEVGASKSLPDFLSDGPIHQRRTDDSADSDRSTLPYSPRESSVEIQVLQTENLRLRREVEWLSSVIKESNDRLERRERRHQVTTNNLEKELDSTRENLRRTMERAIAAEATVCQLQQEVKSSKVHKLQRAEENSSNCSNVGDGNRNVQTPQHDSRQRLGLEIQNITDSAETSIRQLLNNVETLRLIASSLEKATGESSHHGEKVDESKEDPKKT
ncbi:uncharacterized protein l(3)04053 [Bemisia tabaci]